MQEVLLVLLVLPSFLFIPVGYKHNYAPHLILHFVQEVLVALHGGVLVAEALGEHGQRGHLLHPLRQAVRLSAGY